MEWISVKDKPPTEEGRYVVVHEKRPFEFYIAQYSKCFEMFEVWNIGHVRLYDPIPFQATHYYKIVPFEDK